MSKLVGPRRHTMNPASLNTRASLTRSGSSIVDETGAYTFRHKNHSDRRSPPGLGRLTESVMDQLVAVIPLQVRKAFSLVADSGVSEHDGSRAKKKLSSRFGKRDENGTFIRDWI